MSELVDFSGKVAVVTGAGRGIGRQTAHMFAARGAKVLVNDLGTGPGGNGQDSSFAEITAQEIRDAGGEAFANCDSVASHAGGRALVEAAMDAFGHIDFLVNNAGVIRAENIEKLTDDDFDAVLAVSVTGYFATIRAAAKMFKERGGAIVNLASPSAFGHYGMVPYSTAKAAVIGMTRAVARDLGPYGVRCNAILPITDDSALVTDQLLRVFAEGDALLDAPIIGNVSINEMGIPRRMEDVAAAIGWLCSESSFALNGREVFISGGQVALVQEPELVRSEFNAKGWTVEQLSDPGVARALTWGEHNRFVGVK